MPSNNKISNLISSQVPFFVRNDHPNFVRFLELYYEYLEQNNKTIDYIKNLNDYQDIDLAEDDFAEKMYDTFIRFLPVNMLADRKQVLKHIKDFYRAKGTEKSVRFLMRILYNVEVEFYYPKRDIFQVSGAKWFIEKSIRVGDVEINGVANTALVGLKKFTNTRVRGSTSNAFAIIESVDTFFENGVVVNELKLSGQERDFTSGEEITTQFDEDGATKTLTARIFSGIIGDVTITNGGSGYVIGDTINISSNSGTGGQVIVSSVSNGTLKTVAVIEGGVGFQTGDYLLVTGGGGSGANANVSVVLSDGSVHPNSYNIIISTIADEANTLIGNTFYSNVNVIISDPANNSIENVAQSFAYANTGPVSRVEIILPGENYTSLPSLDVIANTRVRALGILGLIKVVDGGVNYQINDQIVFANTSSTGNLVLGTGARANVSNVDANGAITAVRFVANTGHIIGGTGYSDDNLPLISVLSANGTNANVVVTTTLGNGEKLQAFTDSIGTIKSFLIINRGSGYTEPPTLNLTSIGDGTAQATATIITGIFTYPGRYISDDGIVSGYNFIQDRDYYQNYSYVIRTKQSLAKYRQAINELAHPAGMKLFGEFLMEDDSLVTLLDGAAADETEVIIFNTGEYESISGNVAVNRTSHELVANASVWLEFITGDGIDGKYTVTQSNANTFFVLSANTPNTSGSVSIGYMI
jgi:hypothetical protein